MTIVCFLDNFNMWTAHEYVVNQLEVGVYVIIRCYVVLISLIQFHKMEENKEKFNKAIRCLDSFKDILSKMNHQTKSMCSILSNFDNRLLKLEETIQPIYKETGNLQMKQENIVKILEKINFVIKFYTVANEVEAQVTAGPGSNLKSYLEKLDRLREAICYFEENNAESPELMNVVS